MPSSRMPVVFVGHGSPMNAIEDTLFTQGWRALAQRLPRPRAVLCMSAHWETRGTWITAALRPDTIHDFGGFPQALFEVRYPAQGDPQLAQDVARSFPQAKVQLDPKRGLDHGAWSVLLHLYPQADVPVLQLSIDTTQPPGHIHGLGRALAPLRDQGVLLLGTGNIVHNLGALDWHSDEGHDWALRFNAAVKRTIEQGAEAQLFDYPRLDPAAARAVPSAEHFLPLLFVLGARESGEAPHFFNDTVVMGAISMTGVAFGL